MQDQVNQLNERGIKAMYFKNNTLKNPIDHQFDNAKYGNFKLAYLSPERLLNKSFFVCTSSNLTVPTFWTELALSNLNL